MLAEMWKCKPWEVRGIKEPDYWEKRQWLARALIYRAELLKRGSRRQAPQQSESDVVDALNELGI